MTDSQVKTESDKSQKLGIDGLLKPSISGEMQTSTSGLVSLRVAFVPKPIKRGLIVVTECYVGTTGARFHLKSIEARLEARTRSVEVTTHHEIEDNRASARSLTPSFEYNTPTGSSYTAGLGVSSDRSSKSKVSFSSGQDQVVCTQVEPDYLLWSYRPHRGDNAIADFLEEDLEFVAHAFWKQEACPSFQSIVEVTDRRFFGPDRTRLSGIASAGLLLKMLLMRISMPARDPVVSSFSFSDEESCDE